MNKFSFLVASLLAVPLGALADGGSVSWTNWNQGNVPQGVLQQNGATITVTFRGDSIGILRDESYDASNLYDVPASFTYGSEVNNTPGTLGTIKMMGGPDYYGNLTVNSFHFSQAVINPYIDLSSVGRPGDLVTFNFLGGASFTLLSQGAGHWGAGSLVKDGQSILGYEGNGLLRFNGVFTDISFTTPNQEFYYGATVGAATVAVVPEPSSFTILLLGLAAVACAGLRRRRR